MWNREFHFFSRLLAPNVLLAGVVFYFGPSKHCRFVKNIAIKLNKLFTENYIAIFFLQEL
jgi:Na+/glutamate symporter